MSDSTSVIADLLLTPNAAGQAVKANDLFNAASPAMLYANDPATTSGLDWGYIGGRLGDNDVPNDTVALTDDDDNYVVAAIGDGTVSASTGTTDWGNSTDYLRLYKVTTADGAIDSFEDHRQLFGGSSFAGGTLSSPLNEAPIGTLASASTVNIGAANANTISISGTTTITAFDTIASGAIRRLIFQGALTLTHSGTSLILPTGANVTTAAGDVAAFVSLGSGNWRCIGYMRANGHALAGGSGAKVIQFAASDETTALTTGAAKITLRAPLGMTLNAGSAGVRGSLTTAQATNGGGGIFTVDINVNGSTILSTKLTIDNTEKTSTTAATPVVVSSATINDDDEISVDIDQIGDGTAKGLKIALIGA